MAPLRRLQVAVEAFPLRKPFHITGQTFTTTDVVVVTIEEDGRVGRGEATGLYYRTGDDVPGMLRQIETARASVEAGIDRETLCTVLPAGGARTAIDCALWDLEARLTGKPAWQLAGLAEPRPLVTTFTIGADTPATMVADAARCAEARALKLKLTGSPEDAERVQAVRAARPDVWLGVDANQGFTPAGLRHIAPALLAAGVALVEQPFRAGQEHLLDDFGIGIPLAADESILELPDLARLVGRVQTINIKLDKCGGLTAGLALARAARAQGLGVMVGNTVGTSLSMAPAALLGQLCEIVDLDGPTFLARDREPSVAYAQGAIEVPPGLWGNA